MDVRSYVLDLFDLQIRNQFQPKEARAAQQVNRLALAASSWLQEAWRARWVVAVRYAVGMEFVSGLVGFLARLRIYVT